MRNNLICSNAGRTSRIIPGLLLYVLFSPSMSDHQGGKAYGALKHRLEASLDSVNEEYSTNGDFADVEDLGAKLLKYKEMFIKYDEDLTGDLDLMNLKRMMEKLGQAKTHLELKKMIAEVDTTGKGTISYPYFLNMMFSAKSSVLKIILKFEELNKGRDREKGKPPKQSIADLP